MPPFFVEKSEFSKRKKSCKGILANKFYLLYNKKVIISIFLRDALPHFSKSFLFLFICCFRRKMQRHSADYP